MNQALRSLVLIGLASIAAGCGQQAPAKKPAPAAKAKPKAGKSVAQARAPVKAQPNQNAALPKPEVPETPPAEKPEKPSPPPTEKPAAAENPVPSPDGKFDPAKALPVAELLQKCADPKAAFNLDQAPVAVRGVAAEVSSNFEGTQWSVVVADHRNPAQKLKCQVVESQPWLKIVPGQAVVVQGSLNKTFLELEKADIVAAGENPLPVVSADQLTAESAADRKAANRKYAHKWILCSGVIQKAEKNRAELKVKGDVKLTALGELSPPDPFQGLAADQPTVLLARCAFRPEGELMVLRQALPRPDDAAKAARAGLPRYDPPPEELKPQPAAPRQPTPAAKGTFAVEPLKNEFPEEKFASKFAEQWLTLDGFVRAGTYGRQKDRVTLHADPATNDADAGIVCLFDSTPDALRLMPGQRVKVKGQVPNSIEITILPRPTLQHCELVEAGENPVKLLSASELVAQAKAEETKERSDREWLVCTGTFGGFDYMGNVLVRGSEGASVVCEVSLDASELFEAYFEDDPIRVLGYRDRKGSPAKAELEFCYPVK